MNAAPTIFWFRRDLRLSDNLALLEAVGRSNGSGVLPVFVLDDELLSFAGPTRASYLSMTLQSLNESLSGALILRAGDPAAVLVDLAREYGVTEIFATTDFAPSGRRRDERTTAQLASSGIRLQFLDSPYAVAPGTVVSQSGDPLKVFSAFHRRWLDRIFDAPFQPPQSSRWIAASSISFDEISERCAHYRPAYFGDLPDEVANVLPKAGEAAALKRLTDFADIVDDYAKARNLPGANATSRLSPDLHFGTIHPRQILQAVNGSSTGRATFVAELCWRDFYADVLYHHPSSVRHALRSNMAKLRVDTDDQAKERFRVWARGETGYPLVDAGMRQLLEEGWMHNRVRMVTASFLVKHLHLDWRWGARWFMWRLIDGDVASNQQGWQWTAGTGTDAAPYYRIFNPTTQAERFDPSGDYVHRFIPELRDVAAPQCLQPGAGDGLLSPPGYPTPIVDAATERIEALARYDEIKNSVSA